MRADSVCWDAVSGVLNRLFCVRVRPVRRRVAANAGCASEEAGWHGVFVWDHVRWRRPVLAVADPWRTLAAVGRVRLGPMVTPLARRRPVKVVRETVTLDRLSGGRLTLAAWAEELDERRRARMLDESADAHPRPHRSHGVAHTGADHKRIAAQFGAAKAIPVVINCAAQMVLTRVLARGQGSG
jgi:alkanesulfonate monooxygenase SsuD/methylene tetrahydromethanopterin reductase-like flavin-dependent oxidoreductase (luciferase family)